MGLAACLAASLSSTCLGQDLKGAPRFGDTQVGFAPTVTAAIYTNFTLSVSGPNGFHARASADREVPTIDLSRFGGFDDGMYNFEVTASSEEKLPVRTALDNGRDGGPTTSVLQTVSASGVFHVSGGTIEKFDPKTPEREKALPNEPVVLLTRPERK
ncbi:MAG: hypothetical protein WCE79_05010 [Xanthobacteraceae bacterium]